MATIAQETCECIANKNVNTETTSYDDYKVIFGLCVLESYQKNRSKFDQKDLIDFSNQESAKEFGIKVGLEMIKFCPSSMMDIGRKKIAFEDSTNNNNTANFEEEVEPSVTGTIFQINYNQFLTFSIKEVSGRTVEFILLNNFDNSFLLIENLLKQNDIVDVYYYESELFDAKINKYLTYKVVTDIIKK